ncbi:MAG: single-stranded DNA-binding protein [bacterium]
MVNRVVLVGRITRDPEATVTASGITLVRFTIAVNRNYKDANGERQADFISCIAWRFQAEFLSNYVKKGNQISVEGRIQTGSYTDSDNQVRYTTDVLVESVSNLEPRNDNQNFNNQNNFNAAPTGNSTQNQQEFAAPSNFDVSDDDLPF